MPNKQHWDVSNRRHIPEVPRISDGAARRVPLRLSSCMTATPAEEIMHIRAPARITFVYLKTLNGLQIRRRRTRVTSWEQSIRHTDRFWMGSRITRCRAPSARRTAPMSSWFPRDRNVMKGGVGSTTGF